MIQCPVIGRGYLLLIYSIGTTNGQSAAFMLALDCHSALNLDCGGSSEIVRADTPGRPYIVNNPSGGTERCDAAALGVYALPLEHTRQFRRSRLGNAAQLRLLFFTQHHGTMRLHEYLDDSHTTNVYSATGY
jgi:hypothetical protein